MSRGFPAEQLIAEVQEASGAAVETNPPGLRQVGEGGDRGVRVVERSRFRLEGAKPTSTALRFDPVLPFETWKALGARLALHSNASLWWLGDWLHFGKYKYGRRYREAIALTKLDYQTLRNYATVARRFEPSRRRDDLSFHHHAEVCALTDVEQDHWLDEASLSGWSRNELRRRLRPNAFSGAIDSTSSVRLPVANEWLEAAAAAQCALEMWIVRTLNEAAVELLELGSPVSLPLAAPGDPAG